MQGALKAFPSLSQPLWKATQAESAKCRPAARWQAWPGSPPPASLPPEAHLYSEQALGELLKPRLRSGAAEVSQWLSRSPSCPDWKASEVTWAVLPYFRNDTLEETTAFPKVHSVADRTGGRASCAATLCMITNTPGTVQ